MWVRDEEPQAFSRARRVLQAKDFIVHRLTGRMLTDPSDASSTNAFDQTASIWSTDLIAAAELNLALFPEIVPSTQVVGTVTGAAAAYTGLAEGTPVVIGGGDGPMAALGAGVLDPCDGGYAYLGTSSWVSIATSRPLHDPAMQTMTFNHVVPGAFVPTATMQTGGGALEWLREVLDPGELTSFGQLLSAMAGVQAATDGLFFLPYLLGERSPYWNPQARAAFIGLCRHHTQAHLTRAVVEGVAFNLRTGLLAFASNGTAITRVDAIGGAAASSPMSGGSRWPVGTSRPRPTRSVQPWSVESESGCSAISRSLEACPADSRMSDPICGCTRITPAGTSGLSMPTAGSSHGSRVHDRARGARRGPDGAGRHPGRRSRRVRLPRTPLPGVAAAGWR
jgi:sugar (pentulose or hexulose) kinase